MASACVARASGRVSEETFFFRSLSFFFLSFTFLCVNGQRHGSARPVACGRLERAGSAFYGLAERDQAGDYAGVLGRRDIGKEKKARSEARV